jgi:SAM-dependent methyltransferase
VSTAVAGGPTPYDAVSYPGFAYPQTHPDRLATQATLFGMAPAAVATARVLELGCGDGGNLLPMALTLPEASFTGIDLSPTAVERGRARAARHGADNLDLRVGDLADLPADLGTFDYVLAHGVFSWVPPAAREGLLAACGRVLADQGVAYVSYNAYPGSHLRDMARGVLRFHVRGIDDPAERVRAARDLLRAIVAADGHGGTYARVLREHAEQLLRHRDWLLFHDDLAEVNQPFWFHEVAAMAAAHGLQFLAEADLHEMRMDDLPEEAAATLEAAGDDVVQREQYLDIVKNRMFRQTLLCRAEVALDRTLGPGDLAGLSVACAALPAEPREPGRVRFEGPEGAGIETDSGIVQAAFLRLAAAWPGAVAFPALCAEAHAQAGGDAPPEVAEAVLADALLRGYLGGLLALHAHPPAPATAPGERPRAFALAREQAAAGDPAVTTLRHGNIHLDDPLARHLIGLLDGSRDRDAIVAAMRAAGERLPPDAGVVAPPDEEVGAAVDEALALLARLSLLEA